MIYTVAWLTAAENRLAEIWMSSADPNGVTTAANRLERDLRRDAHLKGQEYGDQRVAIDEPLALTFRVSVDDRLVTITWVQELSA